jgi:predicted nucleotidyltransferase
MSKVEKTLKVIRELKDKHIIQDFAIGGGVAVLYYTEPVLTYDLDIFFIPVEKKLDVLSTIYTYLKEKGYKPRKEHVQIEGVPVQFIPVYNELVEEAVQNAPKVNYGRLKTQVIGLEYLVAIMLQVYRAKDRERLIKIFEETDLKPKVLRQILEKFELKEKYDDFRRIYFG